MDPSLLALLASVERVVDGLEHVLRDRPLVWIKILDELKRQCRMGEGSLRPSQSFLKLTEVEKIASQLSISFRISNNDSFAS